MSGIAYYFSGEDVQAFLQSPTGNSYLLTVTDSGQIQSSIDGTGISFPQPYVALSGDTMTGTLNVPVMSATTISGLNIYQNGVQVIDSGTGAGTVSVSKSNGTLTISGTAYSLPSNVVQSASNSGVGVGIYNSQNGSNLNFNTISGVGSVTLSGPTDGIITISGLAVASSSGINLGSGFGVFDSLSGSNLQFNSITGIGSLAGAISVVGNTIIISGSTSVGAGDVVGPASSLTDSIATYADATGKLLKDANGVTITPSGTLNATNISTTSLSISGTVFYPNTLTEIDFGSLPVNAKTFTITDARVTANSLVTVQPAAIATTGRTADDWQWDNIYFSAGASSGTITLYANTNTATTVLGTRKIQYQIY